VPGPSDPARDEFPNRSHRPSRPRGWIRGSTWENGCEFGHPSHCPRLKPRWIAESIAPRSGRLAIRTAESWRVTEGRPARQPLGGRRGRVRGFNDNVVPELLLNRRFQRLRRLPVARAAAPGLRSRWARPVWVMGRRAKGRRWGRRAGGLRRGGFAGPCRARILRRIVCPSAGRCVGGRLGLRCGQWLLP
jgi:hypothetical protein